jgi:hypothetical protein
MRQQLIKSEAGLGNPQQHVAQILDRIDAVRFAGSHEGVHASDVLASLLVADEEKVRRSSRVLAESRSRFSRTSSATGGSFSL